MFVYLKIYKATNKINISLFEKKNHLNCSL